MATAILMSKIGDGAFKCSLSLSPKVLSDSPIYSSSQSILPQLYLLAMISLSFGDTRMFLSGCPPLKCTANPCFPHMCFILSHMSCAYSITMSHLLASSPKCYGLPKIHKKNIPLRPIISSIGSVSYGVAKELAKIIKPLVGTSEDHVNNTKEFTDEERPKLEEGECITYYDVTALFTSVPVSSALEIIKDKLELDTDLPNRSIMTADNIIELLGFCLNNTYFCSKMCFMNKQMELPWRYQ